jgi:hypothetical protein
MADKLWELAKRMAFGYSSPPQKRLRESLEPSLLLSLPFGYPNNRFNHMIFTGPVAKGEGGCQLKRGQLIRVLVNNLHPATIDLFTRCIQAFHRFPLHA